MIRTLAAICTVYHPLSHADVIVTRWLDPHPRDAAFGFVPTTRIASLYVGQQWASTPPPDFHLAPQERIPVYDSSVDLAQLVSTHYQLPLFPTVRDALTLGGDQLAVDGVLLIAEHGDYPLNGFDQKLYPRKELFDEIIAVFRESNRVVPLFFDKHLSWDMDAARAILHTVVELQIPLLAGSSLPLAGLDRDLRLQGRPVIDESLAIFYNHLEVYGFHSLEVLQSLIEQRAGGETGVVSLCAYEGDAVWEAIAQGIIPQDLFAAALNTIPVQPGDYQANCAQSARTPVAIRMTHADGHRSFHLLLEGHVRDFAVALRCADAPHLRAARVESNLHSFVSSFAVLNGAIQSLMLSGQSPVPPERIRLTTLATATWMQQALPNTGREIETPHLRIAYAGRVGA